METNTQQTLKKLVKKKKFTKAEKLALEKNLLQEYITLLTTNRDYKKAYKLLKDQGLDYNDHPNLIERAQKMHVRYILNNNTWVGTSDLTKGTSGTTLME